MNVLPGIYRHFKGGEYDVIGVAKHSETQEEYVVYQARGGDGELWVRPLALFLERVERGGYIGPRFVRVE